MSLFTLFKRTEPPKPPQPDLDSTFFSMKVKQLPSNFAHTVMDLEMRLEFDSQDLSTVQQLNDLYKLAVEYYIHEEPKKATHFQRKLTALLSNSQTLQALEKNQAKCGQGRNNDQYQRTLRNELGTFNSNSQVFVEQMLEGSSRRAEKNGRIMRQQLNGQQERLRARLEERSKSKNRRPFLSP